MDVSARVRGTVRHRAVSMAGARVIELEDAPPGGILYDGPVQDARNPRVPLTEAQVDARFDPLDAGAFVAGDSDAMAAPYFRNGHVGHPAADRRGRAATAGGAPPAFTHATGDSMRGELRFPAERLAMVSAEALRQRAAKTDKVALAEHVRRQRLLSTRHPEGAIRVDSYANPDAAAYTARRREHERRAEAHGREYAARHANLHRVVGAGRERVGYAPMEHVPEAVPTRAEAKFMQVRAGAAIPRLCVDSPHLSLSLSSCRRRPAACRTPRPPTTGSSTAPSAASRRAARSGSSTSPRRATGSTPPTTRRSGGRGRRPPCRRAQWSTRARSATPT